MGQTEISQLQQALDVVEKLRPEDQEALLDVIRRRLTQRRRKEISRNAAATLKALREGRARYGTVEDLKNDLVSEP